MRLFEFQYDWFSRPMYRTGKKKTMRKTFAAGSLADAYQLAREHGAQAFPRRVWHVVLYQELKTQ